MISWVDLRRVFGSAQFYSPPMISWPAPVLAVRLHHPTEIARAAQPPNRRVT